MPKQLIHGVTVKKLQIHCDERGRLMEMVRSDDKDLKQIKFGQVYMTTAYPGVVKGWHYHREQVDHFAVVKGMLKLVLYEMHNKRPSPAQWARDVRESEPVRWLLFGLKASRARLYDFRDGFTS